MAYKKRSAGLLLFRRTAAGPEVLLGHMGGPFWERRDAGAWTVPKGEYGDGDGEGPWEAARREFQEELGLPPPDGTPVPLGEIVQSGVISTRPTSCPAPSPWSGRGALGVRPSSPSSTGWPGWGSTRRAASW